MQNDKLGCLFLLMVKRTQQEDLFRDVWEDTSFSPSLSPSQMHSKGHSYAPGFSWRPLVSLSLLHGSQKLLSVQSFLKEVHPTEVPCYCKLS